MEGFILFIWGTPLPDTIYGVERFLRILQRVIWGPPVWGLLLFVGLMLSVKTGFMQVTKFGRMFDETFADLFRKNKKYPQKGDGDITPWQSVTTAFSATMGVGTLAGTATAIGFGGPGAVFWMWAVAFFGMLTKAAECSLAFHFRSKNDKGEIISGPFAYMEKGLGWKGLAVFFAIAGTVASFGIGNMVQSNSAAWAIQHVFGWERIWIGIVAAVLIGLVTIGGIKRIAAVMVKVTPTLAIISIISCILIILSRIGNLPGAFAVIMRGAFTGHGFVGGAMGVAVMYAIRFGLMRGVFSNEAGLGSAPMAYAAAKTDHPMRLGFWAAIEVFMDTIVMCSLVAFAILVVIPYDTIQSGFRPALTGSVLIIEAWRGSFFGEFGAYLMAFLIGTFGFTTVIGWTVYGEKCYEYLFGTKTVMAYRVAMLPVVVFGATGGVALVWAIADCLNAMMAIPNIIAIIALSSVFKKLFENYLNKETYVSYAEERGEK